MVGTRGATMAKKKPATPNSTGMNTRGKSLPSTPTGTVTTPNKKEDTPPTSRGKGKRAKSAATSPDTSSNRRTVSSPSPSSSATKNKKAKQRATNSNNKFKALPPFPLYQDVTKASVAEGLDSIVNLLRGRKNIVVLNGAGISVSCGIPDFRSKGSGLYSTLDHEDLGLSCPEELFDWEIFREDPRPFYKFAANLYFPLGNGQRVRPSDSHKLLALLEQKKMLLRVYSQNIDGLEQVAGVSPKKVVYAHGSLQWASCCKCKRKVSATEIEPAILKRTVPLCQEPIQSRGTSTGISSSSKRASSPPQPQPSRTTGRKRPRGDKTMAEEYHPVQDEDKPLTCGGVLKPGVTFFGEALDNTVRKSLESDRNKVDALIVIGTSLSVAPMSKVIGYMPANIPRILINRTIVHPKTHNAENEEDSKEGASDDDSDKDFRDGYVFDAYMLGYCDDVTRLLAKKLFSSDDSDKDKGAETHCQLLANVRERGSLKNDASDPRVDGENHDDGDDDSVELDAHKAEDWASCKVPDERVVLFHGAEPSSGYGDDGEDDDVNSQVSFREVAHCDGCTKRIVGTIRKCVECFDYDLCQKCFPKLSKTHYNGEHVFAAEPAAVV